MVITAVAGCGSRGGLRGQAWVSGDRTTYVYQGDRELVAVRGENAARLRDRERLPGRRSGPAVRSDNGRRAIALGWRSTGGSIRSQRLARGVGRVQPRARHRRRVRSPRSIRAGSRGTRNDGGDWPSARGPAGSDRRSVVGPHDDLYDGKGRVANLALPLGSSACDIIERADAVVVACARYQQTSAGDLPRFPRPTATRSISPRRSRRVPAAPARASRRRGQARGPGAAVARRQAARLVAHPARHRHVRRDRRCLLRRDDRALRGRPRRRRRLRPHRGRVRPGRDRRPRAAPRARSAARRVVERERAPVGTNPARVYWLADGRILVSGFGGSVFHTPAGKK